MKALRLWLAYNLAKYGRMLYGLLTFIPRLLFISIKLFAEWWEKEVDIEIEDFYKESSRKYKNYKWMKGRCRYCNPDIHNHPNGTTEYGVVEKREDRYGCGTYEYYVGDTRITHCPYCGSKYPVKYRNI